MSEPLHKWLKSSGTWILLAFTCWLSGIGCACTPYQYSRFRGPEADAQPEVVFEYGRPQKTLDRIAYVTGIWSRVLTLSSRVNKHELTDETKAKLVAYMEENDITDVLVRVNQYDPNGEWQRLRENHRISPGWRYTVGTLSMLHYVIIPGRVFGGDEYNPYTNTLYLNSDVSAVALHEAAFAKDIHSRMLPGTYAALNEIPILSLWRHTKGVNDVLGYAQVMDDWTIERETYCVVYPQMGIHGATIPGRFLPLWDEIIFSVAGATAGHATGRFAIVRREAERNRQEKDTSNESEEDEAELALEVREGDDDPSSEIQFTSHRIVSVDESERSQQKVR